MDNLYFTKVDCWSISQEFDHGLLSVDVEVPANTFGIDTGERHPGDNYVERAYYCLLTPQGRVWISKYNLSRVNPED
jgi:hypothetical protein